MHNITWMFFAEKARGRVGSNSVKASNKEMGNMGNNENELKEKLKAKLKEYYIPKLL